MNVEEIYKMKNIFKKVMSLEDGIKYNAMLLQEIGTQIGGLNDANNSFDGELKDEYQLYYGSKKIKPNLDGMMKTSFKLNPKDSDFLFEHLMTDEEEIMKLVTGYQNGTIRCNYEEAIKSFVDSNKVNTYEGFFDNLIISTFKERLEPDYNATSYLSHFIRSMMVNSKDINEYVKQNLNAKCDQLKSQIGVILHKEVNGEIDSLCKATSDNYEQPLKEIITKELPDIVRRSDDYIITIKNHFY